MSPPIFFLSSGALVIAGVTFVALEFQDTRQLRDRYLVVSEEAADLDAMHPLRLELTNAETELHDRLQAELDERDGLRAAVEQLHLKLALPVKDNLPPKPQPRPANAERDKWHNVGRNTPAATFETVLSTIERSDVDALSNAIGFDDAARAEAERLYAVLPEDLRSQYDSPQSLVAALMAVNTPIPFDEMNVIKETVPDSDNGVLHLSVALSRPSRQPQQFTLRFQRDAAGWRLLVPALIIDGYRHRVMGTTSLAEPDPR